MQVFMTCIHYCEGLLLDLSSSFDTRSVLIQQIWMHVCSLLTVALDIWMHVCSLLTVALDIWMHVCSLLSVALDIH